MKQNKILVWMAFLALNTWIADAQTDTTKTQIEKMTIIGTVDPTIKQVKKTEINPEIKNETVDFPVPEYQINTIPSLQTTNEQKMISFQQLPKYQIEDKNLRNYLILGFANYVTPLAEFYANMQAHRNHAFGLHVKHVSSQGGIDDYAKNAYSHNNIDAFYKYMGSNFILKADVYFDRDVIHYYGFKPKELEATGVEIPADDSIKQRYALVGGKVGISNNTSRPTDFQYFFNLGFSNFSDRYKNHENNFSADFQFNKGFDWFRFSDYQTLGAILKFDNYNERSFYPDNLIIDSTNSIQRKNKELRSKAWMLDFQPYIGAEWDEYYVRLGIDFAVTKSDSGTVLHVHPAIETKIKVVSEKLDVFVGLGGGIERNSMKSMTDENPFIAPAMAFVAGNESFMNKKITIYGGVNANILEGWDLKAGVNYSYVDDMPFYTVTEKMGFVPTYQPFYLNVNELNIFLKTNYSFTDRVRADVSMDFYSYTSKDLEHAYYKPNFKLSVFGEYRPIQKLKLNVGFRFYSKMWACNSNDFIALSDASTVKDVQLPCLYDLSLGGEYNVWKELYVFLNINNICAQNYERYLYYPTQGIMVMGGAKYRF